MQWLMVRPGFLQWSRQPINQTTIHILVLHTKDLVAHQGSTKRKNVNKVYMYILWSILESKTWRTPLLISTPSIVGIAMSLASHNEHMHVHQSVAYSHPLYVKNWNKTTCTPIGHFGSVVTVGAQEQSIWTQSQAQSLHKPYTLYIDFVCISKNRIPCRWWHDSTQYIGQNDSRMST